MAKKGSITFFSLSDNSGSSCCPQSKRPRRQQISDRKTMMGAKSKKQRFFDRPTANNGLWLITVWPWHISTSKYDTAAASTTTAYRSEGEKWRFCTEMPRMHQHMLIEFDINISGASGRSTTSVTRSRNAWKTIKSTEEFIWLVLMKLCQNAGRIFSQIPGACCRVSMGCLCSRPSTKLGGSKIHADSQWTPRQFGREVPSCKPAYI